MSKLKLQLLVKEFTDSAKKDIKSALNKFMNETEADAEEVAEALSISDSEIDEILDGDCNVTLDTLAKILIATGNAFAIKPIEQTPLAPQNESVPHGTIVNDRFHNPYDEPPKASMPSHMHPHPPIHFPHGFEDPYDEDDDDDEPTYEPQRKFHHEPRFPHNAPIFGGNVFNGARKPMPSMEGATNSPIFKAMTRKELVDIITNKLWDTEIDCENASREALVSFLENKDRRVKELKRENELEADPNVKDFIGKLKKSVEGNPKLKDYLKNFIGKFED